MPRLLRKSFLERNQLVIGIIGILFLLGGSAFALLLSGGVFASRYEVTARFTDAAGLKTGDDVTVAGLDAGTVSDIRIDEGVVAVTLEVDSEVELPSDSRAEIVVETLLGKKSVELHAGEGQERLADGDVIPIDRTTTPIEITELNDRSVTLLERSDARALEQLMEEVTAITEGKSARLRVVIDGLADVSRALNTKQQELKRLLDSLETLATTFAERDQVVVSLIDRFDVVLANLAERRGDLVALLRNTDDASHEVASLVERNRPRLDAALRDLHSALQVVDAHQLDLAATIPYLEASVRGYSSVGYSQDVPNRWANIFVQSLGPLGTDAILGPCGLFDQALDEILGPDPRPCEDRENIPEDDDGEPEGPDGGGGDDDDDGDEGGGDDDDGDGGGGLPGPDDDPPLPGDIGDLIEGATGLGGTL